MEEEQTQKTPEEIRAELEAKMRAEQAEREQRRQEIDAKQRELQDARVKGMQLSHAVSILKTLDDAKVAKEVEKLEKLAEEFQKLAETLDGELRELFAR